MRLPCDHGEITDHHVPTDFRSLSDDLDTTVVGFNTHCTDIPYNVEISDAEDQHFGYHGNYQHSGNQSYDDRSSDELSRHDGSILSAPRDNRRPDPDPDFSVTQQHSRKDFKLLNGHKYRKQFFG